MKFSTFPSWVPALFLLCFPVSMAADWTVASNAHFQVCSQSGEESARSTLAWFEQLRSFFQRLGFALDGRPPVEVVGFRSQRDYDQYRLRPAADAYYVGTEGRDYIVVPDLLTDHAGMAAHEYAHLVLHANGIALPAWLSEGLAEYFSTLHMGQRSTKLGGDLPMRSQVLRRSNWMPLSQLLAATNEMRVGTQRAEANLFYAQSWALAEMLILSPAYKARFPELLVQLSTGASSANAFTTVYRKSSDEITADLHRWMDSSKVSASVLPPVSAGGAPVFVGSLSLRGSRLLMAELLFHIGDLDRAEGAYRLLLRESPDDAEIYAALGSIALRRGNREEARHHWQHAMQSGLDDANLCYRYALLADELGLPQNEITDALERAIHLQPELNDARYKLALMNNNNGRYAAALDQLLGMKQIGSGRAFGYWAAVAYAYDQLGDQEKTKSAALEAAQYAATPVERERASQLLYFAETDVTTQAVRDANGSLRFVTVRVKRGTGHRNLFIEPEDHIVRIHAQLTRVDCTNQTMTGVGVDTDQAQRTLTIADPQRVLMENAPQEFTCGPQSPANVIVEYAASQPGSKSDGLLRGMEFEKPSTTGPKVK